VSINVIIEINKLKFKHLAITQSYFLYTIHYKKSYSGNKNTQIRFVASLRDIFCIFIIR